MLKIYNSLSDKLEEFKPLDDGKVKMYVCGPTVYDRVHLGNARSIVFFDVLFRLMQYLYGTNNVNYIRNITDVDDKIINSAEKQNIEEKELSLKMTDFFHEDCKYLNCLTPTFEPKVTEEIDEIIKIIQKIIDNGNAYINDGNVVFSVSSFPDYGLLSKRKIETNKQNIRIGEKDYKQDQNDFLLWKKTEKGISWNSPWGIGRPGWHIECSAMSNKYLGENFDIHGGGVDLKFPHHENEIAQSKCANKGSIFAKYWVHNGFLMIEGQKMSKSLGNFITINNVKEIGVNGNALRLALLSTHYRKPMNYSKKLIQDSEKMYNKFCRMQINKEKYENIKICNENLLPLLNDINTTAFIGYINKLYNNKEFEVVKKLLNFIGIELIQIN